jgi:hypothetical protein
MDDICVTLDTFVDEGANAGGEPVYIAVNTFSRLFIFDVGML